MSLALFLVSILKLDGHWFLIKTGRPWVSDSNNRLKLDGPGYLNPFLIYLDHQYFKAKSKWKLSLFEQTIQKTVHFQDCPRIIFRTIHFRQDFIWSSHNINFSMHPHTGNDLGLHNLHKICNKKRPSSEENWRNSKGTIGDISSTRADDDGPYRTR